MAFSWFDKTSGNTFNLPYFPQSRDELERMLVEMRAKKEIEVTDPTREVMDRSIGAIGEGVNSFMNSSALKPVADMLRAPGGRETARAFIPGYAGFEAIPGLLAGGAAAIGAGWDNDLEDVPDIRDIISREAREGFPTALEQIAPVDVATLGFGMAAKGASSIPRLARLAGPLAKAARASDIFEGVFGAGQVVHGAATGDPLEAGVGAVRFAGGLGSALPAGRRVKGVDEILKDVAPYVEDAAKGLGYSEMPNLGSFMVPEGSIVPGRPPIPEGHVRVFRSGDGNFFTTNEPRAGSYEGEGSYVDVPEEIFKAGQIEASKHGQPTPQDTYLPDEWVKKAQRLELQRETFDATEEVDADKLFEELGVKRVGGEEYPVPIGTVGQVPQKMIPPDMVFSKVTNRWETPIEAKRQAELYPELEPESPLGDVDPFGGEYPVPIAPPKALEATIKQRENFELYDAREAIRIRQEAESAAQVRAGTHDRYGRPITSIVEESALGDVGPLGEETPRPAEGPDSQLIDDVRNRIDFEDAQRLQPDEVQTGGEVQLQQQLALVNNQLSQQTPGTSQHEYLTGIKQNLEAELTDGTAEPTGGPLPAEAYAPAGAPQMGLGALEAVEPLMRPPERHSGPLNGNLEVLARPADPGAFAKSSTGILEGEGGISTNKLEAIPEGKSLTSIFDEAFAESGGVATPTPKVETKPLVKPSRRGNEEARSLETILGKAKTTVGKPGVTIEPGHYEGQDFVVFRDEQGQPAGVLAISKPTEYDSKLEGGEPITYGFSAEIAIRPDMQRKGVATHMIEEARKAGLKVDEALLGPDNIYSDAGASLVNKVARPSMKAPEIAGPLKEPALEGAPTPKKQTFADFMQTKFGDKSTTSKERAIARAEWNSARDERKLLKLAENAGIPPEKIKAMMEGTPKEGGPEAGHLSALRRAAMPFIENIGKVHPKLKEMFMKYLDDAETPSMKNIADSWRIKRSLKRGDKREVVNILTGKKNVTAASSPQVQQAARSYRAMLDQTLLNARDSGTISEKTYNKIIAKYGRGDSGTYFPKKFADGWDDYLVQTLHLDKNRNRRNPHLEKRRLTERSDWRRDLDVLDEYFLSGYRRISEVTNFGPSLQILLNFASKHVSNKATAKWIQTNIDRVLGREDPTSFDRFSGHARHIQALSDLGWAALYQPVQATNIALLAGLGRSMKAITVIARNAPDEVYDAIRSRALVPDITQELIAGTYGAREGIPTRFLQKYMHGIPTIDRWTRIVANTTGKALVNDAMKRGWFRGKGALKDIKGLGFEINNIADLQKAIDTDPDFALKVGKELSDKALYRSGAMELPGWASSTTGKLATQYARFMYRHSLFIRDIFIQARQGNIRPLARLLTVAPLLITGFSEVLLAIREGMREIIRQKIAGEDFDMDRVIGAAIGDENLWDEEIQWYHILRNKRIPWTHPLKRSLQDASMWGGVGIFQTTLEKTIGSKGTPVEVGARALLGPVPTNVVEGLGSAIKDINALPENIRWNETPGKNTTRWGAQQIPWAGYPIARRLREELNQ